MGFLSDDGNVFAGTVGRELVGLGIDLGWGSTGWPSTDCNEDDHDQPGPDGATERAPVDCGHGADPLPLAALILIRSATAGLEAYVPGWVTAR